MNRLKGKTAVITGGTTGIGYASAKLFLAEGARVIVTGQDAGRVAEAAASLGDGASGFRADVASRADLDALAAEAKQRFGHVDVVFANAGIFLPASFAQADEAHFDRLFDVNVKGVFLTIKALEPLVPNGGSIIITSSTVDEMGLPNGLVYASTKAAVRSFARTLTLELAPRNIRVNTVAPGPIETPIFGKSGLPQAAIDAFSQELISTNPAGRFGQPEEIATVALFLASDESSYVRGHEIVADGGAVAV